MEKKKEKQKKKERRLGELKMENEDSYLENVKLVRYKDKLIPITKNLVPNFNVYGEDFITIDDQEWRTWDPYRSKFSAALMSKMKKLPQLANKSVLYLGAASGTTPSHFSDIIGLKGRLFALEFSKRVAKKLYEVASVRENMIPLVKDARYPESYSEFVFEEVEIIFQDISQADQTHIFARNVQSFLKSDGIAIISIKSQSIDSSKRPKEVFREQERILEKEFGFNIIERKSIERFEKAHSIIILTF